ncbi:MAG: hypothetical protein BGP25_09705 [Lysobacterales bacterium 63-13]|nr:MAG: hypothetical protein BGP25_09705 [Xanthomonadales bacterium 63-13]
MNVNSKTPMALYKANLELVLRIGTLLQENRQRWMQAGAAGTSEAVQRTLAETERMLTTNDWNALAKIPGAEFWNSLGTGTAPLQGTVETAVRSQTEFAEGLKQAFAEWQQQSAEALGGQGAYALPWTFSEVLQAFNAPGRGSAGETAAKAKTQKPASASKSGKAGASAKAAPAKKPAAKPKARKPAKQ